MKMKRDKKKENKRSNDMTNRRTSDPGIKTSVFHISSHGEWMDTE